MGGHEGRLSRKCVVRKIDDKINEILLGHNEENTEDLQIPKPWEIK